ncbi:MAG TPA: thiolase family protein [Planctomycetota bacterium]|jgi:acetyl-CoA acetyltransferase family protein|nr:thiolase family protein [Planctomycetota bacterium]
MSGAQRAAIFGGVRTPFCRAGTDLSSLSASDLATLVVRETLVRAGLDGSEVDEVILGCVGPDAGEANPARVAAVRAGLPVGVPAATVGRNCASGFEAITAASDRLAAGRGSLYVVGGTESMSNYPLSYPREFGRVLAAAQRARGLPAKVAAFARLRPRSFKPRVAILEGLTDPTCGLIMGKTAELLAREFRISREEQDRFACESQNRAERAREEGRLGEEILPVFAPEEGTNGSPRYREVRADNGIRPGQTVEALARLRPYFETRHGTVTVGNSSQITDGACALLLGSEERGRALGLAPLGYLRGSAYAGCEPARMGLGPVYATARVLDREGLALSDFERIEINEAFAAQVLACLRAFASERFAREELGRPRPLGEIDPARLNGNGGAVALGHPVGSSGARLVLTLLREMRRSGSRLGLATLCVGGGQGGALVLEAA